MRAAARLRSKSVRSGSACFPAGVGRRAGATPNTARSPLSNSEISWSMGLRRTDMAGTKTASVNKTGARGRPFRSASFPVRVRSEVVDDAERDDPRIGARAFRIEAGGVGVVGCGRVRRGCIAAAVAEVLEALSVVFDLAEGRIDAGALGKQVLRAHHVHIGLRRAAIAAASVYIAGPRVLRQRLDVAEDVLPVDPPAFLLERVAGCKRAWESGVDAADDTVGRGALDVFYLLTDIYQRDLRAGRVRVAHPELDARLVPAVIRRKRSLLRVLGPVQLRVHPAGVAGGQRGDPGARVRACLRAFRLR